MLPGGTVLSGAPKNPRVSEFKVMRSPAGYYVGTTFKHGPGPCDCDEDCPTGAGEEWHEMNSRETGYFNTQAEAEQALSTYLETGNLPGRR